MEEEGKVTDATEPVEPLMFDLMYRRQPMRQEGATWIHEPERLLDLPEEPEHFKPMRGYNGEVAKEAERLNNVQERSRFLNYFYFPEVAKLEDAR